MAKDAAYREAERRIDDALRSGTTVLDLSGMELTELPESPTQLAQVQVLLLYNNNNLKLLPDWLGQLTRLQRLNLGNTKLTAMPEVLRHLPHLRWLNLGSNILRAYKGIEKQLDLGQKSLDSVL